MLPTNKAPLLLRLLPEPAHTTLEKAAFEVAVRATDVEIK
jgi:hypothetical protein